MLVVVVRLPLLLLGGGGLAAAMVVLVPVVEMVGVGVVRVNTQETTCSR